MTDYIVELLLEEMPPSDIDMIAGSLGSYVEEILKNERIDHGEIEVFSTARRFGFIVHDLQELQKDTVVEKKGPSEQVAYKGGRPTKALDGFLRSNNAQPDEIVIMEANGGRYVYLKRQEKGKPTIEILPQVLPKIFSSFQFTRPMKWGNGDHAYTRPVHSILSLMDSTVIKFEFMGKSSSNLTKSHRFLQKEIAVKNAQNYEHTLKDNMVVISIDDREKMIRQAIENCKLDIIEDDALVHEIALITEFPQPVIGQFKNEYLNLPQPVLKTVLRHHQRTFITRMDGKVSNEFLAFQDGPDLRSTNVKKGYERVINARLSDAEFYMKEDMKYTLEHFNEKLTGMTFQKELGTIADKVKRIRALSSQLSRTLNFGQKEIELVERASVLSKSDLGTNMVYEFPELQGTVGSFYAKIQGEAPRVINAIIDQYAPDGLEGDLPSDTIGAIIGVADRLDTIVANFSIGEIPTGSRDPYALRKKVFAILRILSGLEWDLDLEKGISVCESLLDKKVSKKELADFFKGRLEIILKEKFSISQDVSKVVAELWNRPLRAKLSAQTIEKNRKNSDFDDFVIAYTRVHNISRIHNSMDYHVELFDDDEKPLFMSYIENMPKIQNALDHLNYDEAFADLKSMKPLIDDYFNKVFVMSPREDLRLNRLGFLKNVDLLFMNFGDLSLLVKTS